MRAADESLNSGMNFAPPDLSSLLVWFAFAGTAVFAISGALQGLRQEMDIVGVAFLASLTGIGGGTLRDLLLGATPVGWVLDPTDLVICIGCAVLTALFNRRMLGRRLSWLVYADAVGMGLFAVLGTAKALDHGASPLVAVLFGAMSATFGGVIRDVVCQQRPIVFHKEIYVSAALLGGLVYLLSSAFLTTDLAAIAGVFAALSLRLAAVRGGWHMPFPDYR